MKKKYVSRIFNKKRLKMFGMGIAFGIAGLFAGRNAEAYNLPYINLHPVTEAINSYQQMNQGNIIQNNTNSQDNINKNRGGCIEYALTIRNGLNVNALNKNGLETKLTNLEMKKVTKDTTATIKDTTATIKDTTATIKDTTATIKDTTAKKSTTVKSTNLKPINHIKPTNVGGGRPASFFVSMTQNAGEDRYVSGNISAGGMNLRLTEVPGMANKLQIPIKIKGDENYTLFGALSFRQQRNKISANDVGKEIISRLIHPGIEVGGVANQTLGAFEFKQFLSAGVEYDGRKVQGSEINLGGSIGTKRIPFLKHGVSLEASHYFDTPTKNHVEQYGVCVGTSKDTKVHINYVVGNVLRKMRENKSNGSIQIGLETKLDVMNGLEKVFNKVHLW